jgi:hypothetical protein
MIVMGWLRWRVTQERVRKAAAKMLDQSGDQAFFAAHEQAWRAQGDGDDRKAKFKKAVCEELARSIQRREILRAIIPPVRRGEPPRNRETGRGEPLRKVDGKTGFIEPTGRARRVK